MMRNFIANLLKKLGDWSDTCRCENYWRASDHRRN